MHRTEALTHLFAVPHVDDPAVGPVDPATDRPRLHRTGLHVGVEVSGLVLKAEVSKEFWSAVHLGDHPLDGLDGWFAFLPGHVPAIVIPSPNLHPVDDLPEAGAVLLGHVVTLVGGLVVVLHYLQLLAPGERLHLHHWLGDLHLMRHFAGCALGEELNLQTE